MSASKFPLKVKIGNTVVKIHRTPLNGYESHTVVWYEHGKRQRKRITDLAEARQEAQLIATQRVCMKVEKGLRSKG